MKAGIQKILFQSVTARTSVDSVHFCPCHKGNYLDRITQKYLLLKKNRFFALSLLFRPDTSNGDSEAEIV